MEAAAVAVVVAVGQRRPWAWAPTHATQQQGRCAAKTPRRWGWGWVGRDCRSAVRSADLVLEWGALIAASHVTAPGRMRLRITHTFCPQSIAHTRPSSTAHPLLQEKQRWGACQADSSLPRPPQTVHTRLSFMAYQLLRPSSSSSSTIGGPAEPLYLLPSQFGSLQWLRAHGFAVTDDAVR